MGAIVLCGILGAALAAALALFFLFRPTINLPSLDKSPVQSLAGMVEPIKPAIPPQPELTQPTDPPHPEPTRPVHVGAAELTADSFTRLDVNLGIGTIRILAGEGYALSLESSGKDKYGTPYELHSSLTGGVLSIWSTPDSLSTDSASVSTASVVITLPKGTELDWAKISIGMGDLGWTGCAVAGKLTCKVGMGDIDVSGPIEGSADLETSMGSVTLVAELKPEQYSYDLETGVGTLRLDGKKQSGTELEGGTGESSLELSSGMRDVELSFGGAD